MNEPRDKFDQKPSWRERDAKNNRSPHALKDNKPFSPKSIEKRTTLLAKKELDDLFKPKMSAEEIKAWKEILLIKPAKYSSHVGVFVNQFGYPKDWNDLIYILDHDEPAFVTDLLGHMTKLLPEQTPSKRELFCGKLKVLLASVDDYALSKTIQGILTSEFPT